MNERQKFSEKLNEIYKNKPTLFNMQVVGKCKEDFEKWYDTWDGEGADFKLDLFIFYRLPKSMQQGVFVLFFDSVNIMTEVEFDYYDEHNKEYFFLVWVQGDCEEKHFKTRQEAQTKAMEKANEIHNNK